MVSKQDISSSGAKWFVRTVGIMEEDGKLKLRRKLAGEITRVPSSLVPLVSLMSVCRIAPERPAVASCRREFAFLRSRSAVSMFSRLRYRWERRSRQPHLWRKQGWSVRNRKNTGAENTDTPGTSSSLGKSPGVLSTLCVSLTLAYIHNLSP